jgi:hypothetical protein
MVQGTATFKDYQVFLRSMGVALSGLKDEDPEFLIYSIGPAAINSFISEFSNISEKGMRARGKKIRFYQIDMDWAKKNILSINYFAYLDGAKSRGTSSLVDFADKNGVEVGIFRY